MIKFKKNILIIICLLILEYSSSSTAQEKINFSCETPVMNEYLLDGQTYTLVFDEKPVVTIYLIFFSNFDYRIHICSPQIAKFQLALYDKKKKLLLKEYCDDHEKYINLQIKSNLAAILEIKQLNEIETLPGEIKVNVGFKENKRVQFK